jgi:hypothetical protein
MDFHRIRIKIRRSGAGDKFEVVKETHKAGNWNGEPDEVEVVDRGLTKEEAVALAEKTRNS